VAIDATEQERLIIIRETLRHYREFRELMASDAIDSITACGVTISLWDLDRHLDTLSPRKREALTLNIILDLSQREAARRMRVSVPTVGMYVRAACAQIARRYFADDDPKFPPTGSNAKTSVEARGRPDPKPAAP